MSPSKGNCRARLLTYMGPKVRPQCSKAFSGLLDLRRHMEVHDLRGPVSKCADIFPDATTWGCAKDFTNPEALTRHFDSHTVFFPRDLTLTLGEP